MFCYTKSHLFRIKLILMISIDFHPCIDIHRINQSSQLTKLTSIILSFILNLLYFTIFFPTAFTYFSHCQIQYSCIHRRATLHQFILLSPPIIVYRYFHTGLLYTLNILLKTYPRSLSAVGIQLKGLSLVTENIENFRPTRLICIITGCICPRHFP